VSCSSSITDGNGQASYTYAGNVQGNTQITGVVTPSDTQSNDELARVTDKVGFDGVPTIHAPRHHRAGRVHVTGTTRAFGIVRLYKKVGHHHWVYVGAQQAASDGSYDFHPRIRSNTRFGVRVDRLVSSVSRLVRVP
jgi:hypothetical protein